MRFASEVFDKHSRRLQAIDNFRDMDIFLNNINLKVEFSKYAKTVDNIHCTEAEWDESEPYLLPQLKALISRYSRLGENAFYKYYLPVDNTVENAVELIKNPY